MSGPPVAVEQLTHYYGEHPGVIEVTFQVDEGEIFGFLGPNGAGKTTAIRHLMGLLKPTSGSARVFGLDCWTQSAAVKASIGYLPGDIHLYERMTGHELLDFFASFRRDASSARRAVLAERLELDLSRQVRQLSKGNRQKLAIVQALMHGAPLLILDEPTSGLDPLKQSDFLELLEEERRRGVTILLSSHQLDEVERVATRVAIIRAGRVVDVSDIDALRARRERTMLVVLERAASLERLTTLEGVRLLSTADDGLQLELAVRGPLQPLLRALGELPVSDLVFGPPDLESAFMHFYDREQAQRPAERVAS